MAQKNLKMNLLKLLPRAKEANFSLYIQVARLLGYQGEDPSIRDLEGLLDKADNTTANEAIELLKEFKGSATQVSPRAQELAAFWQENLDKVDSKAYPILLAKAQELTSSGKVLFLDSVTSLNCPDGFTPNDVTRWNLYNELSKGRCFDSEVGYITGVTEEIFTNLIRPALDWECRKASLEMFVKYCPSDYAGIKKIRRNIKRHLEPKKPLGNLLKTLESFVSEKASYYYYQDPLLAKKYEYELCRFFVLYYTSIDDIISAKLAEIKGTIIRSALILLLRLNTE